MIQINGHLSRRAPAEKVNRDWDWNINNIPWFPIFNVLSLFGSHRAFPFFFINFTFLSVQIENIFGCTNLNSKFLGCRPNSPIFLINEKNQFSPLLRLNFKYFKRNVVICFFLRSWRVGFAHWRVELV